MAKQSMYLPRELSWVILGLYLGYPKCCIAAFPPPYRTEEEWVQFPLSGTGFVACPQCSATKSAEQLIAEINSQRVHPDPFRVINGPDPSDVNASDDFKAFCKTPFVQDLIRFHLAAAQNRATSAAPYPLSRCVEKCGSDEPCDLSQCPLERV